MIRSFVIIAAMLSASPAWIAASDESVARPAADSIHSIYGRTGGVVTLPAGLVTITQPLRVWGCKGTVIQGHPDGTTLVYRGDPVDAIVDMRGTNGVTIRNLTIKSYTPGVYAGVMVSSLRHSDSHGQGCTACEFERVTVDGHNGGVETEVGFAVGPRTLAEADANNDWHVFRRCTAIGYKYAAFRINGSQCHSLKFDQSFALNYSGSGQFGWAFDFGCFALLDRCAFFGHTSHDVYFAGNAVRLELRGCNSEQSAGFMLTGNSGASFPVIVDGLRWDGHSDRGVDFIRFRHAGPLTIRDSLYGGGPAGAVPQVVIDNPLGVMRMERVAVYCYADPAGNSVVVPWGPEVDARCDAATLTWVKPGDSRRVWKIDNPVSPIR